MRKSVWIGILCICLLLFLPSNTFADEIVSEKNGLDIMFVMDVSGSMRSNDRDGMALDMVKAFMDTAHMDRIRIGFTAYNDQIVSFIPPRSAKASLDPIAYEGNTDIGLGIQYVYSQMESQTDRNRIMVLISDGETDLNGSTTGRTVTQSRRDLNQTVQKCKSEKVPIYTIAFGKYDGSKAILENMAEETGAVSYTAKSPEALIQVLYGIFGNHLSYQIQELTNGIYAKGTQEIRYQLDEKYLDELDLLLVSPQQIGRTSMWYGKKQVNTTQLTHYAVGKITNVKSTQKELSIQTTTAAGQKLKAYLISYRSLTPVLKIADTAERKESIPYQVYFVDKEGKRVQEEAFYKQFQWKLQSRRKEGGQEFVKQKDTGMKDGVISGKLQLDDSGAYQIKGTLTDTLGSYSFTSQIKVRNTPPSGSLPKRTYTMLSSPEILNLDEYFKDSNGDSLQYSMEQDGKQNAEMVLTGNQLHIRMVQSGIQAMTLFVSDGEDTLAYPYQIEIIPLWKVYWWAVVIFLLATALLLWKILHKPKPELQQIIEQKATYRFQGKLDAYFTAQPEEEEEIPPLTFAMYQMRTNRICLGDLLKEYPKASKAIGLDCVFLIADENRSMILYHTSEAMIMAGSSIVCQTLQYRIHYGDVIYITSQNGKYDLEIHYIAMIQ